MTTAASPSGAFGWGIVVLSAATAAVHLYLGFLAGLPLFVLNGLGYLALVAALYAPVPRLGPYKNIVRWTLVGYAALTIVLWIVIGERDLIGYVDKSIEVALIALLVLDARRR